MTIYPIFGQVLQSVFWLEAKGPKASARIFVAVIPQGESWVIRAWHIQRWSYAGLDALGWLKKAESAAERGIPYSAYLFFMYAESLAADNTYISTPLKQKIADARLRFSNPQLIVDFGSVVFGEHFRNVGPVGLGEGVGVQVELAYPELPSIEAMQKTCENYVIKFTPAPDGKELTGIKCVFVAQAATPMNPAMSHAVEVGW